MTTVEDTHRVDIRARYASHTTVEHKVVFYIDGKKYGFRCDDETLQQMQVCEGHLIPRMKSSWETDGIFED